MRVFTYLLHHLYRGIIGIGLVSCCSLALAAAETPIQNEVSSGQLRTFSVGEAAKRRVRQATLLSSHADIQANAISTAVTLTQTFKNNSADWVEGVYVFPLPETAAVDAMTLRIGEKTIIGKIRAKQKAKKIYQAAVKNGQKAALVEQSRENLFTAKAGNIPPHSEVSITLHYVQSTAFKAGQFSLRLPTTYTPRYIVRNTDAADDSILDKTTDKENHPMTEIAANQETNPAAATNQHNMPNASNDGTLPEQTFSRYGINPISIRVRLDAGHTITALNSPSHSIQQTRHENHREAIITLQQRQVAMDKDFQLTWRIETSEQPLALAFSEKSNNHYFTSLLFIPPKQPAPQTLPRETIFIIDTSGSMSGAAIRQAKAGALAALDYLGTEDAFNIVAFNSNYTQLFTQSQRVNPTSMTQARQFIKQLTAGGGTQMALPLTAILEQQPLAEHFRQVVFLTDGAVNNERGLFALIHQKLDKTRLFTIGIGSAPNSFFMRQAAKFGRGTFTYIAKIDEVSEKITQLFKQIQSPQLTDIQIALPQQAKAAIYPNPLADLYLGEPIVAHIKTPQSLAHQEISLSGKTPNRQSGNTAQNHTTNRWLANVAVTQTTSQEPTANTDKQLTAPANSGLAKLWAREKINHLKTLNITSGDFSRHNAEILQLGLDYQLITSQTSFVAVEESLSRDTLNEPLKKTNVANQMPAGNSMSFPTTATTSTLTALLGSLLLLVAMVLALISHYRREYTNQLSHRAEEEKYHA